MDEVTATILTALSALFHPSQVLVLINHGASQVAQETGAAYPILPYLTLGQAT